jgi:hypothetical protein
MTRWLGVAVGGGVICTLCDHLHVTHDVTWYPNPFLWQQAWWTPFLFATASLAAVLSAGRVRRALGGPSLPPPTARQVVADTLMFVTAYVFTAFGHARPNVVLGVLVAFWVARALVLPGWVALFSVGVALAGCLFEAGWSALGMFYYHHPDVLGIARWLPGPYLHGALLAAPVERALSGGE